MGLLSVWAVLVLLDLAVASPSTTRTASFTKSVSQTSSETRTATMTGSESKTPLPSRTGTISPISPTKSPISPSRTRSLSPSRSPTISRSSTESATPTPTISETRSITESSTASPSFGATVSSSASETRTRSISLTRSITPSNSFSRSVSPSSSQSATSSLSLGAVAPSASPSVGASASSAPAPGSGAARLALVNTGPGVTYSYAIQAYATVIGLNTWKVSVSNATSFSNVVCSFGGSAVINALPGMVVQCNVTTLSFLPIAAGAIFLQDNNGTIVDFVEWGPAAWYHIADSIWHVGQSLYGGGPYTFRGGAGDHGAAFWSADTVPVPKAGLFLYQMLYFTTQAAAFDVIGGTSTLSRAVFANGVDVAANASLSVAGSIDLAAGGALILYGLNRGVYCQSMTIEGIYSPVYTAAGGNGIINVAGPVIISATAKVLVVVPLAESFGVGASFVILRAGSIVGNFSTIGYAVNTHSLRTISSNAVLALSCNATVCIANAVAAPNTNADAAVASPSTPSPEVNIPLVVGLVVGVGGACLVLLLILILYCLCCRGGYEKFQEKKVSSRQHSSGFQTLSKSEASATSSATTSSAAAAKKKKKSKDTSKSDEDETTRSKETTQSKESKESYASKKTESAPEDDDEEPEDDRSDEEQDRPSENGSSLSGGDLTRGHQGAPRVQSATWTESKSSQHSSQTAGIDRGY